MATLKQIEASRANGAKSRGPVTPEGKSRVALNAIKHGLHAKRVVLANEDPDLWDKYIEALHEEWQPETVSEIELIHDLAAARWRLYRVLDYETALMDLESLKSEDAYKKFLPEGDTETLNAICWQALNKEGTLPPIHRQEIRLRRVIRESLSQLVAIQNLRLARTSGELAPRPEQQALEQNKPGPLSPQSSESPLKPSICENKPESPATRPAQEPAKPAKCENKPDPSRAAQPFGDRTRGIYYVDYGQQHRPAPGKPGDVPESPASPAPPPGSKVA